MARRPSAERASVRRRTFRQESLARRAAKVSPKRTTIACRVMGLLSEVRQLPYGRAEGSEGFRDGGGASDKRKASERRPRRLRSSESAHPWAGPSSPTVTGPAFHCPGLFGRSGLPLLNSEGDFNRFALSFF